MRGWRGGDKGARNSRDFSYSRCLRGASYSCYPRGSRCSRYPCYPRHYRFLSIIGLLGILVILDILGQARQTLYQ